jgi:mannosyltransferase
VSGSERSDPRSVLVLAPNMNRRFSGVTATIIAVVPHLARRIGIRAVGKGLPAHVPSITWPELFRHYRRGPWRIWHARRNIEMLTGLVLRHLLRFRLILVFTSAAQRRHSAYTRWLYGRMARVLATTEAAASYLVREATVVYHGVDAETFRPPEDGAEGRARAWKEHGGAGERGIGIFGRVRPNKGTEEFIDALCATLPNRPEWGAVVIGETTPEHRAFRDRLVEKVRAAGLAERVRFVGKVENFAEIPDWYRAVTLVVTPPWVEGFGLTCLEAMASGCAIVATRTGAFEEVIEEGTSGWIVPCRDGAALARRLDAVLDDPRRLAEVGEAGRRRIEGHFTIQREAEKLASVYEELLEGTSGGA